MRFGFWFDYDQTYTFVSLFQEFAKRVPNSQVSGFVVNDRYFTYASENLPRGSRLLRFYDLVGEGRKYVPNSAELADFRAMDERHRLSRVAYSDRHLSHWRYEDLIGLYVYLIAAFRKYVDEEKPEIFIFDCIASQYAHLLYLVLAEKGVKVFIPTQVGVEDLFYLADEPQLNFDRAWALFREMEEGRDRPSVQERAWARGFVDRIRSGGPAYVNSAVVMEQRKFIVPGPGKLLRFIDYLRNYVLYDRYDPTLPKSLAASEVDLSFAAQSEETKSLFHPR